MKTMTSLGGPLALTLALAGCSGGEIYVEPTKTQPGSTASGLCALSPDQDVCARTFDLGVDDASHAKFVGFLEAVTAFAASGQAARDEVSRACEAIVDGLGVPRPTYGAKATVQDIARTLCTAAEAALKAEVERGSFDLTTTPPTCTQAPPPACATDPSPRTRCSPAGVALKMHDGASARAMTVGTTLLKSLGLILDIKSRVEASAQVAATLTQSADGGAAGGSSSLATSCVAEAVTMAQGATDDIGVASQLSARLLAAIEPDR